MEGYGIIRDRLSRYRLFWTKNIYDRQGAEQMFFSAVRENCAYHYRQMCIRDRPCESRGI